MNVRMKEEGMNTREEGMKREGKRGDMRGIMRNEGEKTKTHQVKDIRDWFERRIKDESGSTGVERIVTCPTTPRPTKEAERAKRYRGGEGGEPDPTQETDGDGDDRVTEGDNKTNDETIQNPSQEP